MKELTTTKHIIFCKECSNCLDTPKNEHICSELVVKLTSDNVYKMTPRDCPLPEVKFTPLKPEEISRRQKVMRELSL